jgi:hypothetical protein
MPGTGHVTLWGVWMRSVHVGPAMVALALFTAGCSEGLSSETSPSSASGILSPSVGTEPAGDPVTEGDYDPDAFADPTTVDNRWFPLRPGTKLVYSGGITDNGKRLDHRVVFIVTDLVKVIDGVTTAVVWDRDYTDGQLVEGELAFFAQDDAGNVWSMGEYPEEYDDGEFAGAPDTWIVGLDGAQAGVHMRAHPAVGTSSYLQGLAPEIDFKDRAMVLRTGRHTCIPLGCYDDVLVTDEWNPDEPGAHQRKFYVSGLGNVRVGFAGPKEKERETLVLVEAVELTPEQLATVRRQALELDERGFTASVGVYARTEPAV